MNSPSKNTYEDDFFSFQLRHPVLSEYLIEMQQVSQNVIDPELMGYFIETGGVPFVRTKLDEGAPGCLKLTIATDSSDKELILEFIHSVTRFCLIPKKSIYPVTSRHFSYDVNKSIGKKLTLIEMKFQIENELDWDTVKTNLDQTIHLLERGIEDPKRIPLLLEELEIAQHSLDYKAYSKLLTFQRRTSLFSEDELFDELKRVYSSACSGFTKLRGKEHLVRLAVSFASLRAENQFSQSSILTEGRIRSRVFPSKIDYIFGKKTNMAVAVVVDKLDPYELFNERHIFQAIKGLLADVEIVSESAFSYRHPRDGSTAWYMECVKQGSCDFSLEEWGIVKTQLSSFLEMNIERVMPQVFMLRNEEEVYKNMLKLSEELSSPEDDPQVIVSFLTQDIHRVQFLITLVRPVDESTVPLHKLFQSEEETAHLECEKTTTLSDPTADFQKEGSTFTVWVRKTPKFVRNDGTINLYKAYESVLTYLRDHLGSIREYTGGFIIQQNASFDKLRDRYFSFYQKRPKFLEDFSYSLLPIEAQVTLSDNTLFHFFESMVEVLEKSEGKRERYAVKKAQLEPYALAIIKLPSNRNDKQFDSSIKSLSRQEVISTRIVHKGSIYLGFLCDQSIQENFYQTIDEALFQSVKEDPWLQTLKLRMMGYPTSLDPRLGIEMYSVQCLKMLFNGLMSLDEKAKPKHAIAESHKVSTDQKSYTFYLREAYWSNGDRITAHDFVYAWEHVISPKYNSPLYYLFSVIKNAKQISDGLKDIKSLGVKAVSDTELQVELEYPIPYFLDLTTLPPYFPVNSKIDQSTPDWPLKTGSDYICNGPFKISNQILGKSLSLTRNPRFWDADNVKLQNIKIEIGDHESSYELYQQKKIDWVGEPFSAIPVKQAVEKSGHVPHGRTCCIVFNPNNTVLKNQKIRQAISCALDRSKLVELLPFRSKVGVTTLAPGYSFLNPKIKEYDNNVAIARKFFHEGLDELQISISDFPTLKLHYRDDFSFLPQILGEVGKQIKKILGVNLVPEPCRWNRIVSKMNNLQHDIVVCCWDYHINSIFYFLGFDLIGGLFNKEIMNLIQLSYEESSPAGKSKQLAKVERMLIERCVCSTLYNQVLTYENNKKLVNFVGSESGFFDFSRAYFKRDDKDIRNKIRQI